MAENTFIWQKELKKEKICKWALFFISPLVSFLYSLFSLKTKTSYRIVFWFFVIYGFCFTVGTTWDTTIDAAHVREEFEEMCSTDRSTFIDQIRAYFNLEITAIKDVFAPTLMFVISRFTSNYHFLFSIYAALFGIVTLKCLRYLTLDKSYTNTAFCFLLLVFFTLNQIFNINGFRYYFSAWVGVYCIFKIVRDGDIKYWLLLLVTPFIHISFFFFVPVFALCYFTKSFKKIWFVILIVSIFFSSFTQTFMENSLNLPPIFSFMFDHYMSKDAVAEYESSIAAAAWYTKILSLFSQIYPSILLVILYTKRREFNTVFDTSLLLFCIPLVAIFNMVMPLSSMGRFIIISYPILAYLWIRCFKCKKYNFLIYAMTIFMLLPLFQVLSRYFNVLPISFFFSNPFVLLLTL